MPLYASCSECDEDNRQGGCARKRCYCGHESCWAFDSWVPHSETKPIATQQNTSRLAKTWAEREEPTWLDT